MRDRRSKRGASRKGRESLHCSGRDTDKFKTCGLAPLPAGHVSAPLIARCLARLECRVVDTRTANTHNLFVLEVVKAWTDPKQAAPQTIHHRGYAAFSVDGEAIYLESRMS